ncbi:endonuclease-3 related protein [Natronobacillus azotifigens]|uniref:Endonuclease III domain-containing protein n=1 Tax=Natronobacillus azotifigens TaxID=472978 RepID=A0A9J6RDP7_9BACI|nr:endonuclease III domain-containing protein [Natronobacillus azotifigens]MCZ0703866.1 endonuclease III domain-containing protein [Natronobacillus azotifigens]
MDSYLEIYKKLYDYYGPQSWWPANTVFEMMVGAILVQNTSWTNVEKVIQQLRPYLTPEKLEQLSEVELAQYIRPSGFFRIKEKRVRALLAWYRRYDYDLDQLKTYDTETLRNELLSVHGIGPETADSILLYACHRPVFVVDAYTRRILARFGYDLPKSYDAFREHLEKELPNDVTLFNEFHALFVEHAKRHCKVKPICKGCPLETSCAQRIKRE